jgi:hypothetical protein
LEQTETEIGQKRLERSTLRRLILHPAMQYLVMPPRMLLPATQFQTPYFGHNLSLSPGEPIPAVHRTNTSSYQRLNCSVCSISSQSITRNVFALQREILNIQIILALPKNKPVNLPLNPKYNACVEKTIALYALSEQDLNNC